MKIMVVDDEIISLNKIERIMQQFGECVAVTNGTEAIAAFSQAWSDGAPFNLVILDVSMPGMDGTETLSQIREKEREKNVPPDLRAKIIMATGRSDTNTVATSVQSGCNGYIVKPFDKEKVTKVLTNMWANRFCLLMS